MTTRQESSGVIIEVPIYRVSVDVWADEVAAIRARYVEALKRRDPGHSDDERRSTEAFGNWVATKGLPYSYNQIVGWVQVEWAGPGPVIKGYAWGLQQKRVQRLFLPRYQSWGKVFECWFHEESSEEIADEVRAELVALTRRGDVFARRHVDLEAFDMLASHVAWRAVVGLQG